MPYGKPKQAPGSSGTNKKQKKKGQQQHQAASNQELMTSMSSHQMPSKDRPVSLEECVWATGTGYALSQSVVQNAQPQIDRVMEKTVALKKTVVETAAAMEEMKKKD